MICKSVAVFVLAIAVFAASIGYAEAGHWFEYIFPFTPSPVYNDGVISDVVRNTA